MHDEKPDLSFLHVFGSLCYPTNDSEDLGKLNAKADIGIFAGYAPAKKSFRIYNRRTLKIMETIHVMFDELTAMAFEQFSSGPELQSMTPATSSSALVSNPVPQQPFNPLTRNDWGLLFQPMFDEYFNPPSSSVSLVPVATTPRAVDLAGSPSSTTIDQDAPSSIIMEYLVNISKRRAFWSLNKDILKITVLTTNTPYLSRKIRRIRACTHQRPLRKHDQYAVSREDQYAVLEIMDDLNITMKEYIRLEEEKARNCGKVFNWETAKYAIAFNDKISSEKTLPCEPTVSSLNDEIDFKISFDDSDDEDYTVIFDKNSFSYKIISTNDLKTDSENDNKKVNMPSLPPPEPTVSYFDDLDFFNDFENEFSAIVYNDAPTSKSDILTELILSPQHIDKIDLKDETSLSECDEEEQNILNINDLFPFNVIYPNDSKLDKDNDDDKVDIEHSSEDLSVKLLPDVINTDVGAYAHGSNKLWKQLEAVILGEGAQLMGIQFIQLELRLGKTSSRSFRPIKSADILWHFWASSSFRVSLAHDGSWSK
ncbi:hypothetical protein Tco_1408752 [Tanacetum coccineum]